MNTNKSYNVNKPIKYFNTDFLKTLVLFLVISYEYARQGVNIMRDCSLQNHEWRF